MVTDVLGEFEHQVLLALLRQGEEGYTVPVVLELEQRTGREVAPAAVYITLRRLEEKGLVASALRAPGAGESGRERRYFSVTAKGRARLGEAQRMYLRLWEGLELAGEEGA